VVLFAQPELDEMLQEKSLRQLLQRITFSYQLESLDRDGVERYVSHRLATAGYNGPALFGRRALDLLFEVSRGIPRIINILAHKALMVAYGKGERAVDIEHVRRAAEDTEGIAVPKGNYKSAMLIGLAVLAGLALLGYLVSYYTGGFL